MSDRNSALKLLVVLSKTYKNVMAMAATDIRRYGVSQVEFSILELLFHKGRTPLQKIGDKILMTSGSITYTVDKLEKRGLVTRINCLDDRRVTYAELTNEGRALLDRIFPQHGVAIEEIMGVLTPDEQIQAIELLKKLGHATQVKNK